MSIAGSDIDEGGGQRDDDGTGGEDAADFLG